jgi:hypothetical protein
MSAADLLATGEWEWRVETNLGPRINTPKFEQAADMTADGLTIVFASNREEGHGQQDLWIATRLSREEPWPEPVNLPSTINTDENEDYPTISADGLSMMFSRHVPFAPQTYVTTRDSPALPWSKAVPYEVGTGFGRIPELSSDGLTVVAVRNEGSGTGRELLIGRRSSPQAPWGELSPVGHPVNTDKNESAGTLSDDGRLLIFQRTVFDENNRFTYRLLMATRTDWDAPWSEPVPFSPGMDRSELAPRLLPDGKTLLLSSGHPGGEGGGDIWMARLIRKAAPNLSAP